MLSRCLPLLVVLAATRSAFAAGHVLDNGRVHVVFADPASGYSTADSNRVDSISWTDPGGVSTANLVANGGPLHCNDPQEFFGQAYGDESDAHPFLVYGGNIASWRGPSGPTSTGKTKVKTSVVCDAPPDGGTATTYTLAKTVDHINQLTVLRSFTFDKVSNTSDLRVYVPRLPMSQYPSVMWPNAAGAVQTEDVGNCGFNCVVTDWNGTWMAEQTAAGQGLMIIRDPAKGHPALLVFDYDSYSSSNNSAVALKLPAGGWSGRYVEKENLCFYDQTTWSAARQAAGKLPIGCSVP